MSSIFPPEIIRQFCTRRTVLGAVRMTCREYSSLTSPVAWPIYVIAGTTREWLELLYGDPEYRFMPMLEGSATRNAMQIIADDIVIARFRMRKWRNKYQCLNAVYAREHSMIGIIPRIPVKIIREPSAYYVEREEIQQLYDGAAELWRNFGQTFVTTQCGETFERVRVTGPEMVVYVLYSDGDPRGHR
jgi:hypothetical protein